VVMEFPVTFAIVDCELGITLEEHEVSPVYRERVLAKNGACQ
jgi:hypothetical protein